MPTDPRPLQSRSAGGPNQPFQLTANAKPVPGYRLVRPVGKGGFGEVWKAVGPGGFPVAMKFVRLAAKVSAAEQRALGLMKSLRHPNLLALHGSWQRGDWLILAMELADGTLLDRLRQAVDDQRLPGIPLPELLRQMHAAAEGLDYLNAQGVQHRDVKPHNLLLVGGGVKVADFGLAKVLQETVASASGSMTPAYASPEACNDRVSRWSDQYSLAITYCQLRGNRLPFEGPLAAVVAGHMQGTPDLEMILAAERPAVARALAKAPHERWPSCAAFVAALAPFGAATPEPPATAPSLAGGKARAPERGWTLPVDSTPRGKTALDRPAAARRSSLWLVATGGLALLAAVLFALLLGQLGQRDDAKQPLPDNPQAKANGLADKGHPKEDGKPSIDKERKPKTEEGKEDDGKKAGKEVENKDKQDDGKKEKVSIPPPVKEFEVLSGPPSAEAVELARFEPPTGAVPVPLLLHYDPAKTLWQRLERGPKPARVWTARPLVSLPGFGSNVLTDSGVRLTLAGTMTAFFSGAPVFESLVTLHAHDQLDLDLTLHRGPILLTNTHADKPVRVRVRFENTTRGQMEMWDLKLEGKHTEVLLDRFAFFDFDEPFFDDPKHPDRKGPTTQVGLIVLHGSASARIGDVTYGLTAPPGPAQMGWNSRSGLRGPERLDKAPAWAGPNPPAPKGGEEARADMRRAATVLNNNITGSGVETGLRKSLGSGEPPVRKLTVRCFAALDMVPQLVNLLEDEERPDVRRAAIETLRYWTASSRDNDYKLLAALKGHYTKVEAERIVARLHYVGGAALRQPETYGTLIDELQSKRLAIRELAAWHLYLLVPEARKTIPFDAARVDSLGQVDAMWRALAKSSPGHIPPRFAMGPGTK